MKSINTKKTMEDYIRQNDWRVKENSTISYSIGGSVLSNAEAIASRYWLTEIYDKDIADAHKDAYIHIHDLGWYGGYCAGWSLGDLIKKGLVGVASRTSSSPAKHLVPLINQMVNFIGIMANEWAGAQAFSSLDTYLAPFVKVDNMSYKEVKQAIQSFIFGLNFPNRWGSQAPFSNVTLDWTVPHDLAKLKAVVGGEEQDFTYGDCKKEMDMLNKAFIEVMLEGDANGRGHQYPIPTYSITKDFDWDIENENNKMLFEMTAKYGTPYFSNYVNSDMNPEDVRSMCCRLRLDLRELEKKNGGFFGAGENTGSVGVVTLNLPRIAHESKDEVDFYVILEKYINIARRSLDIKREVISKEFNNGLYPYTKEYLKDFSNHFSTIGILGGNEMCLNANWLNSDIRSKEGQTFVLEVLKFMKIKLSDFQEEGVSLYNLEASPAESTSYRFAKHDREKHKSIITAGSEGETPYYTNSTHLPVGYTEDVFDALDLQDKFQTEYTSGTVFHGFLGERIDDWKIAMNLVKGISENYGLPYYTLSPTYSICKNHGYINGEMPICNQCGERTEVYSRITGYYRDVSNWNDGKKQEFHDRKEYEVK